MCPCLHVKGQIIVSKHTHLKHSTKWSSYFLRLVILVTHVCDEVNKMFICLYVAASCKVWRSTHCNIDSWRWDWTRAAQPCAGTLQVCYISTFLKYKLFLISVYSQPFCCSEIWSLRFSRCRSILQSYFHIWIRWSSYSPVSFLYGSILRKTTRSLY